MVLSGIVMVIRWFKGFGVCGVGKVIVLVLLNRDSD